MVDPATSERVKAADTGFMSSVAVIIPVYNGERFLREALDSVFAQTLPPNQVIVVDDGSSDESAAIASSYPGVRLYRQVNGGVSAARNRAVALANTKWVAFLDQDDIWHPRKLELQMHALAGEPCYDASVCNSVGLAGDGSDLSANRSPPSHLPASGQIVSGLRRSLRFSPGTVVLRKALLEKVGGFDPRASPCEDWDLWLRLAAAGCRFLLSSEALLIIRTHESNVSNQSYRMMDAEMRAWEGHIGPAFSSFFRPLWRRAARSHFLGGVALVERERQRPHLGIMMRSLLLSPAGDWPRHKVFLHMLLTRLGILHAQTREVRV